MLKNDRETADGLNTCDTDLAHWKRDLTYM